MASDALSKEELSLLSSLQERAIQHNQIDDL
jgi:hypothetical protein